MKTLKEYIKNLTTAIRDFDSRGKDLESSYYKWIIIMLKLEDKYYDQVLRSGKSLKVYLKDLPEGKSCIDNDEYFSYIYNRYSPVRFSVETMDSIEEIREELKKLN